jgi:CIC family chloride channel protein
MQVNSDPEEEGAPGDSHGGQARADRPPRRGFARLAAGRPGLRHLLRRLGAWVNSLSYLPKWLVLASAIGAVAGLGAVVFYAALTFATHVFLGLLAGYHVPTPAGEGDAAGSSSYVRPWALPLVVVLGGLLSGLIVFTFAPEAEGHGTDAAIEAVHANPRGIRLRAVVVKIVASALTIGSGGSGGREGPTAQISAGFGSLLARLLDLSPEDGRIAVSVGIGSGIGAIFSAPLGGAVLAADIVYRDDFEFEALLPGVFASVIAYAIFGAVFGYSPLFAVSGSYRFDDPLQLLWFAVLGVVGGGIGLLYSKGFYGMARLSGRLPVTRKLRPAMGALLVGLMALGLPEVLGTGYGWVQKGLSGELLHTPLVVILALPLARIAATALSIGTGGSGGVFGPGMVIGAFTGMAIWRLLVPFVPGVGHDAAVFVVVGMMAVFGGISRAPLAVTIMVVEMTGDSSVLVPALAAVSVSWFIVKRADDSIYRAQLRSRADSPAGRLSFGMPLLATVRVGSVASAPRVVLQDGISSKEALRLLEAAGVPGAPVVDERGTYVGTVDAERLEARAREGVAEPVGRLADTTTATVSESATLDVALEALVHAGGQWLAVTGGDRRVVGILTVGNLVRGYRKAIDAAITQVSRVSAHALVVEEVVSGSSPIVGRAIRQAGLPPGCVVVSVQRGEEQIMADASSVLMEGDTLSVLAIPESVDALIRLLGGGRVVTAPEGPAGGQLV